MNQFIYGHIFLRTFCLFYSAMNHSVHCEFNSTFLAHFLPENVSSAKNALQTELFLNESDLCSKMPI